MSKSGLILWIQRVGDSIETYDRLSTFHDAWLFFLKATFTGGMTGFVYYVIQSDRSLNEAFRQFDFDPTLIAVFVLIEFISLLAHVGAGFWHGLFLARILSWLTRSFVFAILLSGMAVVTSVIRISDPDMAGSIVLWTVVTYSLIEIFRYDLLTLAGSESERTSWIHAVKTTIKTIRSFEALSIRELRRRAHDSVDLLADEADETDRLESRETQV